MKNTLLHIWNFYVEGFRSMTLGRTLWLIILVKLFIMFFILRLFFFPNFLSSQPTDKDKEEYESPICSDSHVPLDFCAAHSRLGSRYGYHGNPLL